MKKIILAASFLLLSSTAFAQILVNPATKTAAEQLDLNVSYSSSEIEYEVSGYGNSSNTSIDRDILALSGSYGINEDWDAYFTAGYLLNVDAGQGSSDDDGMLLALGTRTKFFQDQEFSLYGFGQLQYLAEDYGNNADGDIFETTIGLVSRVDLFPTVGFYAGLDVTPISSGNVNVGGQSFDSERNDILGARLGADWNLETLRLRAEYAFLTESTLTLSAGFAF